MAGQAMCIVYELYNEKGHTGDRRDYKDLM